MAKKNKYKDSVVHIKKLKTNYRLTYDFLKSLTEYIKSFPKEHWSIHKEQVMVGGELKQQWSRDISEFKMVDVLAFLVDNSIPFKFSKSITERELNVLRKEYLDRQNRLKDALREKLDGIDIKGMDFSFMKIQPYEYQQQAVRFFELNGGIGLLGDAPGVGKEMPLDTPIPTPEGWKTMGDMTVGQKVFSRDGEVYKVRGVYPQGSKDVYKITFNDGSSTKCGLDHIWTVRDKNRKRRNKGWTTKTIGDLLDSGLKYNLDASRKLSGRKAALKWEIPTTKPVNYNKKNLSIDPYILGALIGDGSLTGSCPAVSIPNFQKEIKEEMVSRLDEGYHMRKNDYPNCPQYYISQKGWGGQSKKNKYQQEVLSLKLNVKSRDKFIPKTYLLGSIDQRIDLLKGLMDSDGSCDKNRSNYHTTSKRLSMDVVELVQSLGGVAKVNIYDRSAEGKPTEYRVRVNVNFCPFNLSEKSKQWNPIKTVESKLIESIEKEASEQQQCISVDSPDNTYLTESYIVTHNTCSAFAYAAKHQYKTLIICPASLALNWKNEIVKFTNEKAHVYKYKPTKKSGKVNYAKEDSLFHVINYESLDTYFKFEYSHKCSNSNCKYEEVSLVKKFKECPSCFSPKSVKSRKKELLAFEAKDGSFINIDDYDLVVLDEAHYIKNDQAERTKLCIKALGDIPRKLLVTGTAIKSKPIEFFTLVNFLFPEEWKSRHHFGVRYCAGHESNFGWDYNGASHIHELYERMSPFTLRRLKQDVLSHLPPKTRWNIPIQLTPAEAREYKKIEQETITILSNGEAIEKNHLTVLLDLKSFIADIKLDRALSQVQDIVEGGEKVVLMSEFRKSAEGVKEHFGKSCVMVHGGVSKEERDNAVHAFMTDPKIKVFSGTIMAAGVGLTLTSSSTLGFLGSAWTPADITQAEDRVHRASTTSDKVHIIKWICEDTIDEDIEALLEEKGKIVNKALDNTSSIESAEVLSGNIQNQIIARLLNG